MSDSIPVEPVNILSLGSIPVVSVLVLLLALSPFLPVIGHSSISIALAIIVSVLLKLATFRLLNRQVAESGLLRTSDGITVGFNHRETDEKIFEVTRFTLTIVRK